MPNSGGHRASAVQVSPYVFATAAHNVVNTGLRGPISVRVYPSYYLPAPTVALYASGWVADPSFVGTLSNGADAPTDYSHDLAFVQIPSAHPLASYPTFFRINSRVDSPTSNWTCIGNLSCDPFATRGTYPPSWFTLPFWQNNQAIQAWPVGYPDTVNGIDNTTAGLPYVDEGGQLWGSAPGSIPGGNSYELYHPDPASCPGCSPSMAFIGSVSPGDSGGPLYGVMFHGNLNGELEEAVLLGVITNAFVSSRTGLASGDFDYNDYFVQANLQYNPGLPISISSPAANGTYDAAAVPNLVGSVGNYSSSIQWSSDVDGTLGTGASVPVAGRLSPGAHNVSAKLLQGGSVPAGLGTVSFTVTAKTSSLTAAKGRLFVPAGGTSASTSLTWNSPSYTSLDIVRVLNGASSVVATVGTSGSTTVSVPINSTATFSLYPRGRNFTSLASTTVAAVPAPTLTGSPSPVYIRPPYTTATTTLTWNAANSGAQFVALYQSCNGNPQGIITGAAALKGSQSASWMTAGETCVFNLYPSDKNSNADLSQLLATTTVVGELASPLPSITAGDGTILIPYGSSQAAFTLSWNAPSFAQVDIYGQQNLYMPGQKLLLGTTTGAGSATQYASVGEAATLWMYPHGDVTTVLAMTTFQGVSLGSLTGTPNPVIVPVGGTSAPFTLAWDAPGTSLVDIYGQQNQYLPGQNILLGTVSGNGSAVQSMSVGEIATLTMYQHGDTTTPLAILNITGTH